METGDNSVQHCLKFKIFIRFAVKGLIRSKDWRVDVCCSARMKDTTWRRTMTGRTSSPGGSWSPTGTVTPSRSGGRPRTTLPLREEQISTFCWSRQVRTGQHFTESDLDFPSSSPFPISPRRRVCPSGAVIALCCHTVGIVSAPVVSVRAPWESDRLALPPVHNNQTMDWV